MADETVDGMDERPTCFTLGAYLELTRPEDVVHAHVTQPRLRATLFWMMRDGEVTGVEDGPTLKATSEDEVEEELKHYEFPFRPFRSGYISTAGSSG